MLFIVRALLLGSLLVIGLSSLLGLVRRWRQPRRRS